MFTNSTVRNGNKPQTKRCINQITRNILTRNQLWKPVASQAQNRIPRQAAAIASYRNMTLHSTYFRGIAAAGMQRRLFSNDYYVKIDDDSKANLAKLQTEYEMNPKNFEAATEYFKQLNREGKYQTVIRLYKSNELTYRTMSGNKSDLEKLREQYTYARETMEFLESAINDSRGYSYSSPGGGEQATNWSYVASTTLMNFVKRAAITLILYYAIKYVIEKANMDSLMSKEGKFEIKRAGEIKQRLDDVKGIDEIKDEVVNVVKMIKNPAQYHDKGAKLHKGVLFTGEPGTGKTLLARAIAGEAGVNFIFCSGSDFDEMFVGVGAKRVRELFKKARQEQPCIIFIDEIDSLLGASRRASGEHSSQRATINQILAEMDGFEKNDNILLIGATNHQESLDPAAIRPGRFDSKIHVPSPDINGRMDIFELYLNKISREDDIEPKRLAQMTPGFTGAEIENLVNTAITNAVHRGKEKADMSDFEFSRDRIMMGIERKKLSMGEKERLHTAIHESGHALVGFFNKNAMQLHKATIVARGPALGVTFFLPDDTAQTSENKARILAQIDVAMGGHVAEELVIGREKISSGCSSDLQNATNLATAAVRQFGMFGSESTYSVTEKKSTSESMNAEIDKVVRDILDQSYHRVVELLTQKDKELRDLSKALYLYDYLDAEEIESIVMGYPLDKEKVREWDEKKDGSYIMF